MAFRAKQHNSAMIHGGIVNTKCAEPILLHGYALYHHFRSFYQKHKMAGMEKAVAAFNQTNGLRGGAATADTQALYFSSLTTLAR